MDFSFSEEDRRFQREVREWLDEAWPEGVHSWKKQAPLVRLGEPDDIADACLFLASPAARFITGNNLIVDGGMMSATLY